MGDVGRPAFLEFLNPSPAIPGAAGPGVHVAGTYASWPELLRQGRDQASAVRAGHVYVVDPGAELASFAALFAVATVADTALVWAAPHDLGLDLRPVGPALYEAQAPQFTADGRPTWAVATSGTASGTPKLAVGYADAWELIALHYERVLFSAAGTDEAAAFATGLPLKFSAAFFMTVLPSLFLCRDLIVFPSHDWTAAIRAAQQGGVFVLGVPALASAACLGMASPVRTPHMELLLGGGYLTAGRVELIRSRLLGAQVSNLYGTAEAGALSVDRDPGHNAHVGFPLAGKPIWIDRPGPDGIGPIATAGPDCCHAVWTPGEGLTRQAGRPASTDYGRFDDAGHLSLEGRVDGAEKLMGVLVQPRSIERHLLELPGVIDVRVRVVRASTGLEHLSARVVGPVTEDEVREHCGTLPEHARPRVIDCVADDIAAYSAHGKL
jgi:acyl-coenzyme A synthetase/AMP-(fatty) acid ligase